MTQTERRIYLIKELLAEQPKYRNLPVPADAAEQKRLLRSLMNVRFPQAASENFLTAQDEYLREELAQKGVTELSSLTPVSEGIYLWQGDITTLRCDAIVNAANSGMTGCYVPCHGCIDNCIHTYAGVQLRQECAAIMQEQGREEETGKAKITGPLTGRDETLLASCYRSCLELAEQVGIKSIAFCCISTGEFHFPNDRAAEIAVRTVREYRIENNSVIKVIFNVFKDVDYEIYRNLLTAN